ncbi:MAG TPA: cysteine synthase family protein [Candidatus Aminicenantes bacterium]|nr:cysteine synthase family protein [Candidatus Aminicenantes bacterium]
MSLRDAIGHTPLIELTNLGALFPRIKLFAKWEGANPGGSVKDRPALFMVDKAERDGLLTREKVIVEPTSGNTGIALAILGAVSGYRVKLFMPSCVSVERRRILEAFGAEVVLTPACEGTDGAILRARALAASDPSLYFMPDQFSNPANPESHYRTTGPEIWEQTEGRITHFVAGIGSTGTLMGVSRALKEFSSQVEIVGIEPPPGHRIQGLKNLSEAIVPRIYDSQRIDRKITVNDEEAYEMTRALVTREGIFAGMSSGAALAGALKLMKDLEGGTLVVLFPDRGDRYLSTTLFTSVCARCPA